MPLNNDPKRDVAPVYQASQPETQAYVGDCRNVLRSLPERGQVDLIFADPPFNWSVAYEQWDDSMPREDYEDFTREWLDGCIEVLAPNGSMWVNIPDDSAAEIVMHLKQRGMHMINWCIWHFRFGQHRESGFINSKVHALYFSKDRKKRTWNGDAVLEQSDRAAIYGDKRTMAKTKNQGMRVPMDVWYGKYWGRIQGNNKERRPQHQNQIPEVYLERVILACSNPGDLVLDPFLGSGTTLTVARAHGRRSIGIEYSPETASSAWQRVTEVGMLRKDVALGQSTAIFERR
jgi:DNA modification methylase